MGREGVYEDIVAARRDCRSLGQRAASAMASAQDRTESFHLGRVAQAWDAAERAIGDALVASATFGGSSAAEAALDRSQAE